MPIYEYLCPKCGLKFSAFDKFTDPTERSCEGQCDGTAKRVPSVPAPAVFNCDMPTYQKPKK